MELKGTSNVEYFFAPGESASSLCKKLLSGEDFVLHTNDHKYYLKIFGVKVEDRKNIIFLFDAMTQVPIPRDKNRRVKRFSITNGYFDADKHTGHFKLTEIKED